MKSGVFLLNIGDELLDGRILNTNAHFFGEALRLAGVSVAEVRAVPDTIADIVKALHDASHYPFVIVSGGLGPTNDDRTAEAAAKAFGKKLRATAASLAHVRLRYKKRKRPVTQLRLRQAQLPDGAKLLQNLVGIAPGFALKIHDCHLFFLPGVPSECRPMFQNLVLPKTKRLAKRRCIRRELWRTFGATEAELYQKIRTLVEPLEKRFPQLLRVGMHISFPGVDISLEFWQENSSQLSMSTANSLVHKISAQLGDLVFSRQQKTLAEVVLQLLREKKKTLSTAESCTGGLVGKLCTDTSGASDVYWGGVISYANQAKVKFLEVKPATLSRHGAVSAETIQEMSENGRRLSGTDYCLALSGISGPSGGSSQKPVGTIFVSLATQHKTIIRHQVIGAGFFGREWNRTFAAHFALDILRRELLG